MASRLTLQALAESLIRESRTPFSAEEYLEQLQGRWRRRIAPGTLDRLRRHLDGHSLVIGTASGEYLPYPALMDRIGHLPLLVRPSPLEWQRRILIPGHRLIPFVHRGLSERDLVFRDYRGAELPRATRAFYIEEILSFYEYSGETHFPDRIRLNERIPGKSKIDLTVWDLSGLIEREGLKPGDGLRVRVTDLLRGRYQVEPYRAAALRQDRLRLRAFHVALEAALLAQWEQAEPGGGDGLERQLLKGLFSFSNEALAAPAFSLTDFVESLEKLAIHRRPEGGLHLAPLETPPADETLWEETPWVPQGRTASLDAIFEDMGLAFGEAEFKALLYVLMGTEDYDVESVFNLLFGGKQDCFHSKRQHNVFYKKLRVLLNTVCADLKEPESRLITQLRSRAAFLKLRLIQILRYFEEQEVRLTDLPEEILDQLADLDGFCVDALVKLADRRRPPDVKAIRDIRLGLKVMLPHLDQLEEDIDYRLGIY